MKTLTAVRDVRDWRRGAAGTVGLVPTMGYLHAGHRSLLERARGENDHVVATIFVNPTQFGPGEDLSRYPRDFARDSELLQQAGCDVLFAPSVDEMYPSGHETYVDVGSVAEPLEGARRPGHFRGVATVVLKLFGIVQPHRAYLGQKDAQQLAVIRRLVADLDVPVDVVACPIVREADGLALSSRNVYLDPAERRAGTVLHRALIAARDRWLAGERDARVLRAVMSAILGAEPLALADYVSVADPATFREVDSVRGPALLSMAVQIGKARLIDNLLIGDEPAAAPVAAGDAAAVSRQR
jgi:pantoate--beta-alanine ligase